MDNEIRLIDANALKEFINDGKVCDICDKRQPLCVYSCDFPDYVTPLWEKVIDSIPTIDDLSSYSDKLWQKAYERGKSEARPQGHWIIEECSLGKTYYCSECYAHPEVCFDFCPYCGADMRGERND